MLAKSNVGSAEVGHTFRGRVRFVAICVDKFTECNGGHKRTMATAQKRWPNLDHFVCTSDAANAFGVFFVPEKVIINQSGCVAARREHGWKGRLQAADVMRVLRNLMGAPEPTSMTPLEAQLHQIEKEQDWRLRSSAEQATSRMPTGMVAIGSQADSRASTLTRSSHGR